MKITFFSQHHSLFLLVNLLVFPLSSFAISSEEVSQLIHNAKEAYIYCDKDHSKMAAVIAEISKLDEDKNSPACQLNDHIQKGFSIGRQDAVKEALAYAEKTLHNNYKALSNEQIQQIHTTLNSVIDAITNGQLTVDVQSVLSSHTRDLSLDQNDESLRVQTQVLRLREKLYALESSKFFKDAKFKQNIVMYNSDSDSIGNILKDGSSFIHNFGDGNTFVGIQAGNFTMDGYDNSGFGAYALTSNSDGSYNTAQGLTALAANQDGSVNTAIGALSLLSNISGEANTAIGFISMPSNIDGSGNTAIGIASLINNIHGDDNTAVGAGALSANSIGNNNTAIGENALSASTGSGNVALGINAGNDLTSGDNNVYIANAAVSSESNTTRIGAVQTRAFMAGVYNTTTGSATTLPVIVDVNGQLGTTPSTRRVKHNIQDMDADSAAIYNLRPVTFAYNNDAAETKQFGLIAEEVDAVFPAIVAHDENGQPYTVQYQILPALLLNEVQKHQAWIQDLAERVAQLENAPAA